MDFYKRFSQLSVPAVVTRSFQGFVQVLQRWQPRRETVLLLVSAWWLLLANQSFLAAVWRQTGATEPSWPLLLALAATVLALHVLLLGLLTLRGLFKPVLAVLIVVAAFSSYFSDRLGIYMDPTMLRNALRTDLAESRELLSLSLLLHVALVAGLPLWWLWRLQTAPRGWAVALRSRLLLLGGALLATLVLVWAVFQPLSSLMRNHREIRYLVTPANVLWSGSQVLWRDAQGAAAPRLPIGLDAQLAVPIAQRQRPLVLVLVVGETVRAANWGWRTGDGLPPEGRQTTPQLAALPVWQAGAVQACGTNTEVSLPCMFAPVGRRDYDEARIRGQQSLLHVLQRAGVQVHWRDNQSGCKGVCDELPQETVSAERLPPALAALCEKERCLDEVLFADLPQRLQAARQGREVQVWVLHMLGNHGPSYFRRYPPAFARFTPECRSDDLKACNQQEIVNAYDNAVLYTDHLLAQAIAQLKAQEGQVDSALLYVSDHGESLGERGLFLHGMPYAIAPAVQKEVPMVFWTSQGLGPASGFDLGCMRQRWSAGGLTHDHLFHTVLGLLGVETALREPALDLTAGCRSSAGKV